MEAHPLLVIFHDPPDVMNRADPVTGDTELHNIWLVSITALVVASADDGTEIGRAHV